MDRVQTYAPLQEILDTELNAIQDDAAPVSGVNGLIMASFNVRCTNGTDLIIDSIDALTLGGSVGSDSSTATFTPGGLSNNTHYYVYAHVSAGSIAYETSTTAPDNARIFKGGDTSRRYVCHIHTYSGAATIRQFTFQRGYYEFRFSAMSAAEAAAFVLVSAATSTGAVYTDIDLNGFVPSWAKFAKVRVRLIDGTNTNLCSVQTQPSGILDSGTNGQLYSIDAFAVANSRESDNQDIPVGIFGVSNHPGIAYQYNVANGACTLIIEFRGWLE
jgi:hypothetical protein